MSESENIRVGIIMGSDSDLEIMQHCGKGLEAVGLEERVDYEFSFRSVHRTTERAIDYAEQAKGRGLQLIIAGAGGSAHLPGIVASKTILPVVGVAITKNPDVMNRALGSTIGMPKGEPLAVIQAEKPKDAFNAGIYVARILALHDEEIERALEQYDADMKLEQTEKDDLLQKIGSEAYLQQM